MRWSLGGCSTGGLEDGRCGTTGHGMTRIHSLIGNVGETSWFQKTQILQHPYQSHPVSETTTNYFIHTFPEQNYAAEDTEGLHFLSTFVNFTLVKLNKLLSHRYIFLQEHYFFQMLHIQHKNITIIHTFQIKLWVDIFIKCLLLQNIN